jgi:hypothetical protein
MIRTLLGINPLWMALGAAVALCGGLYWHNGTLQAQNALLTLRAEGAEARVDTLKQAMERRQNVEALSDDDLRNELSRRVRSGN